MQSTGATTLLEFQNEGAADATGYVAVDHVNNLIVIAFRGSESVANWLGNVNIGLAPYSFCAGCAVHAGFYDSWNSVKPQVGSTLATAMQTWPSYMIVATGHSLGAAMAALAAAELRTTGIQMSLYTYGQPMIGNKLNAVTQTCVSVLSHPAFTTTPRVLAKAGEEGADLVEDRLVLLIHRHHQ